MACSFSHSRLIASMCVLVVLIRMGAGNLVRAASLDEPAEDKQLGATAAGHLSSSSWLLPEQCSAQVPLMVRSRPLALANRQLRPAGTSASELICRELDRFSRKASPSQRLCPRVSPSPDFDLLMLVRLPSIPQTQASGSSAALVRCDWTVATLLRATQRAGVIVICGCFRRSRKSRTRLKYHWWSGLVHRLSCTGGGHSRVRTERERAVHLPTSPCSRKASPNQRLSPRKSCITVA